MLQYIIVYMISYIGLKYYYYYFYFYYYNCYY
jgi:hypothetical protein